MSKRDEFVTTVLDELFDELSDKQMTLVERVLNSIAAEYEIEDRNTDIIVQNEFVPSYYGLFMTRKKLAGRSIGTLKLYNYYLMDFFLYKPVPIEEMDSSFMIAYLYDYQKRHKVSNRTLNHIRIVINGFFQWAVNEGYIKKNFVGNTDVIKYVEKPRQPLTDEEIVLIREACITDRETAFVNLLLSTGMRIGEVERLKWEDIDFNTKSIEVFGKGSKYRTVMFDSSAKIALLKYKMTKSGSSEYVFTSEKHPFNGMKKRSLELLLSRIVKRTSIAKPVSPHVLRHTFATQALSRGMSIEKLKTLLGHEDYSTTLIYAKVNMDQVGSEYRRCFA